MMEEEYYATTELDDLGIYGPTADFGEIYYEDIEGGVPTCLDD